MKLTLFYSIIVFACYMQILCCFDYYASVVQHILSQVVWYLQLCSFSSWLLWLFEVFCGSAQITQLLFFFNSEKDNIGILMGIVICRYIFRLVSIMYFNNNSSTPWTQDIFPFIYTLWFMSLIFCVFHCRDISLIHIPLCSIHIP